jgi:hypothetical protein
VIRDTRKINWLSLDISELVQGSPYTNDLVDFGNIPYRDFTLDVVDKIAPKRSQTEGSSRVPN